jgi:hypothetical protein
MTQRRAGTFAQEQYDRGLRSHRRRMRPYTITALALTFVACWIFISTYDEDFISFFAGVLLGGLVGIALWVRDDPPPFVLNWGRGAAGERKTADILAPLLMDGWRVRHDVELRRGNADHLLFSPGGKVFLLETKTLAGSVTYEYGQLACRFSAQPIDVRRYPVKEQVSKLKASVSNEWARRTGRPAPEIQSVVVVWGDLTPALTHDGDLVVLSGERLEAFLREREVASVTIDG